MASIRPSSRGAMNFDTPSHELISGGLIEPSLCIGFSSTRIAFLPSVRPAGFCQIGQSIMDGGGGGSFWRPNSISERSVFRNTDLAAR